MEQAKEEAAAVGADAVIFTVRANGRGCREYPESRRVEQSDGSGKRAGRHV